MSIYSFVYSFFISARPKSGRSTQVGIDFRDTREGAPSLSATCGGVLLSFLYIFALYILSSFRWVQNSRGGRWVLSKQVGIDFRDTGELEKSLSATCRGTLFLFLHIWYRFSGCQGRDTFTFWDLRRRITFVFSIYSLVESFLYFCSSKIRHGDLDNEDGSPGNRNLDTRICAADYWQTKRDIVLLMTIGKKPRILVCRTEKEMESRDEESPKGDKSRDI